MPLLGLDDRRDVAKSPLREMHSRPEGVLRLAKHPHKGRKYLFFIPIEPKKRERYGLSAVKDGWFRFEIPLF